MSCELSIIIPVHNGAKKIRRTVKKILLQDFRDFELILVENGSSDDSWCICKNIQNMDVRIKAIQSEKGTSLARKAGVLESVGEYVVFSDQDDYYVNEHALSRIIELSNSVDAEIIQFNHYINSFGRLEKREINRCGIIDKDQLYRLEIGGVFGAYQRDITTCVWDKLYNGEILRNAVQDICESLCRGEDMYLNTFAFMNEEIKHIAFFPEAFYVWNTGIGTSSEQKGGYALFEEYKTIKPTIIRMAKNAGVGYEPIMRTHRETPNFLNGLIQQSILSGETREKTIAKLKEYASWEFVAEAARFFDGYKPDGSEWDNYIKQRADIWNENKYYDRVISSLGNLAITKIKYRAKQLAKNALRWADRRI